ncbi:MAG: hypothetical protein IPJ88_05515 [Myxococcales bacterium]|nr:MAG: hypothetical protein IPJ88_05515 [Myxococcales bacterium]
MAAKKRLHIVSPCPIELNVSEDKQNRYCGHCSTVVHNLSAYTEAQAQDLLATGAVKCATYRVSSKGVPLFRASNGGVGGALAAALIFAAACDQTSCSEPMVRGELVAEPIDNTDDSRRSEQDITQTDLTEAKTQRGKIKVE